MSPVTEKDISFWVGVFVAWVVAAFLVAFASRHESVLLSLGFGVVMAFLRVGYLVSKRKP